MKQLSPTERRYSGAEIAEAILVYDELKRCGGVDKGRLDLEKIAAGYRTHWTKDVDISWPLAATVEEVPIENPVNSPENTLKATQDL